ncbi:hypothetical protein A9798_10475 [Edwardsiella hoshinae]|uniref:Energy-coupling factor transporter transmembrane protein EcfT n=1 Tax=Edwardsiella hoshinae TaxID=93378 RepID=A0ABM6EKH0_9GAMM|nr:energy-coupling factor transporter transmembrane component T [Edwardsiella hoshinae]AOV97341.1 hypothetical protein A9798_10475 [Edwardsiella hoshinae]
MTNQEFINRFRHTYVTGNWLIDLNPLTKLHIALALGLTSMVLRNWQFGLAICLIYYLIAIYIKKFRIFNKLLVSIFVLLGLFTVFARLITNRHQGEVVLSLFGWHWTDHALQSGFNMAFFIVGFSGAIILFFLSTPMQHLAIACEEKGMSAAISYVVLVSSKTISELGSRATTILDSQRARGIETEGNLWRRISAFFPIISPLALSAIAYTEEKTIAMDARAFSNKAPHTHLVTLKPISRYEKWLVLFFYLLLVTAIVLKVKGDL